MPSRSRVRRYGSPSRISVSQVSCLGGFHFAVGIEMPLHGVRLPGVVFHAHPVELVLRDGTAHQFDGVLRPNRRRGDEGQQSQPARPHTSMIRYRLERPLTDGSGFDDGLLCQVFGADGQPPDAFPVAANSALQTAGAIPGGLASPIPPGAAVLGTMCTSTLGISSMRSTSY